MAELNEIVSFLDGYLRTDEIEDYPGAFNGLQMQNDGRVDRIVSAVDASLAVIQEAAKDGGLLLVHHGMFWQGVQPLTGPYFEKINAAIRENLAIYSSHLPLDVHPNCGNNVLLARELGLKEIRPILEKKGFPMGVTGKWNGSREEFSELVSQVVGREIQICQSGPDQIGEVAVMTGGAGSEIASIEKLGIKTLVTGEGPHWSYIMAEEFRSNVFYAGHCATETFGVRALGELISGKFEIDFSFIERSGGL
ncbi:MAG: Nif3-like dinuclear metal center hexameric protein [Akkermansiaceae bacterium]